MPYYTWQDIKKHDSFLRYFFVSPIIGVVDSFTWPYQVYTNNIMEKPKLTEKNKLRQSQITNVKTLMIGQEYLTSAMTLTRSITKSKDIEGDFEKINSLMDGAKSKILESDKMILNSLYRGLGDIVHNKLLRAIEYYQSGMMKNGDRVDLTRGDALLLEYNKWMKDNWKQIIKIGKPSK